ncbi:MAG: class I SAM-dependent methyltransferase [Candidatus Omnitrophica bacterium]|nr:class I SAM-dependent methyltransferase [Candidatus Omnitrophota bacterium]
MKLLLQSLVSRLAARPVLFDMLRWILEAGFNGERIVLKQEGLQHIGDVLDLGCGTGVFANMFRPTSYVGIDINQGYIKRARKKHPTHRFLVMDGRALDFTSQSFDAVVISGVIHHLEDQDAIAILTEAARVLKPGIGRLIMWEDVPTRSRYNLIGSLVHQFDLGDHIRAEQHYVHIVQAVFDQVRCYPMSSGACDYLVMVAQAPVRLPASIPQER